MSDAIRPIGWRVLVKPQVLKDVTEGGIALPDEVVQKNEVVAQVGQVIEIGPTAFSDKQLFPDNRVPYKVGDWVIFPPYTGFQVTLLEDGERVNYRLMNDDHVLGLAKNPDVVKTTVL